MKNTVKILHIVPDMGYGGVEKMVLNYYGHLDHSQYHFDFVSHGNPLPYHEDLKASGSKLFYFKTMGQIGLKAYTQAIKDTINLSEYDLVHIHVGHLTGIYAKAYKKAGAKKIICHAHTTECVNKKHSLLMPVFRYLANRYSDYRLACGVMAGEFCFGKGRFKFLPNGINYELYKSVTQEQIQSVKTELGIDDSSFVIGHIGHFSAQKNHRYLLNIAKEYIKLNPKAKFVLVGEGPDFEEIRNLSEQLSLQENVIFAGVRSDIPVVMQSFNVFVLPSLYEGLPVVSIEAQAAGTPCLLSDRIDKTLNIEAGGIVKFLSLHENCLNWVDALEDIRKNGEYANAKKVSEKMKKTGYDINASAQKLCDIYDFIIGDKVNDSGK